MIQDVVNFLTETKKSYKQFDRLLSFYNFKDEIAHKQNLIDVCGPIAVFLQNNFHMKNLKVTTYDIELSHEKILYKYGENFDEQRGDHILSFDFSKSYFLNGRLYFQICDKENYEAVQEDKSFLHFILYELKHILANHLAIEKLKEQSYIDELSGLPNRKFVVKHLTSLLEISKKEHFQISLLKIDVDRFKAVIEEFNFSIGNEVLKKLSKVLQKNISNTDIVTKFEENSFLICMQDVKDPQEASTLAQKCIDDFKEEFVIVNHKTNQKLFKTICIGITNYPDDGETLDELFKNCDIALDEAKNKGRSSYQFFQDEENNSISLF